MIFSTTILAETPKYDNIQTEQTEDGEILLILNESQYTSLMDYVEELEYELKVANAQIEQANKEIEKAYTRQEKTVNISTITLSATAILAIIAALSK